MSIQQAKVYITNTSDGNAIIRLYHNNSSNGTQSDSWNATPGETVGPLIVKFETGFEAYDIMDYWWISLSVRDGSNPGEYASSGVELSEWKECQLQSSDAGQSMTFTVNTTIFTLNEKSDSCTDSMVKIAPYSPITNVFVLMLENHSFDNIFAMSGISGIKAATINNFNSYNGKTYNVIKGAPLTMSTDPGHEFPDIVQQLTGFKNYSSGGSYPNIDNSGFVANYATSTTENKGILPSTAAIGDIMACFNTPVQLPVIYQLATEFAICDHWFSSLPGPTWPNRFFVHGASSAGLDRSPKDSDLVEWELVNGFTYPNGSIYDAMNKADIPWRLYIDSDDSCSDNPQDVLRLGSIAQVSAIKGIELSYVKNLSTFASDLQGAYPYSYTFIEPNYGDLVHNTYAGGSSQHPMDDVYGGEKLMKKVYEAIRNSPLWNSSLLIIIYDEHGGFYDSVAPGTAPAPNDTNNNSPNTLNEYGFNFKQYGVRVPAVIVSPLIAKGTVDHTVYDHSSVLATVEKLFSLHPLTQRDAKANDLRHLFSLSTPRTDCPTQLNNPAPPVTTPVFPANKNLVVNEALPQSGNVQGFLHIMLKTEFELSSRSQTDKDNIIANFKNIKTKEDANAYIYAIMKKVDDVKANRK